MWLGEADGLVEWLARFADGLVTEGYTGTAVVFFGPSDTPGIDVAGRVD